MADQGPRNGIIEAPVETSRIRRVYAPLSRFDLVATLKDRVRTKGIEMAGIRPQEEVLEVAVGVGRAFLQTLKMVDRSNTVCGMDLSPAMPEKTGRLAFKPLLLKNWTFWNPYDNIPPHIKYGYFFNILKTLGF